ncbi:MAG TPA: response regulator transcription factor [Methylomirabilota bacterium]|jgi:DNA-binding NarL/FixJ family response regulator
MTRTEVFIVADGAVAARMEALLRRDPGLHVVVVDAAALATRGVEDDMVIVVLALPAAALERVLETLRRRRRVPAVVVATTSPRAAWSARARRAGVRAVVGEDASAEELTAAVMAVRAGLLVLDPRVLARAPATPAARGDPSALTTREAEILDMMAEGMSNRAIGGRLKISRHTVKFHVASILTKLAARSRTEAVTLGLRHGLISL